MKKVLPIYLSLITSFGLVIDHAHAQCGVSSLVINTGYDPATGSAIAPGAHGGTPVTDPYWKVTAESPSIPAAAAGMGLTGMVAVTPGAHADIIPLDGAWISNPVGHPGGWISCVNGIGYFTDGTGPSGTIYSMTVSRQFQMSSADNVTVSLNIANDNWISAIDIDGINLSFSQPAGNAISNYGSYTAFTQSLPLTAGVHTINVYSHNYNGYTADGNPAGVNIYGTVASATASNSFLSEGSTSGSSSAFTVQPANVTVYPGFNATFNVVTTITAPTYQWQEDAGSGFVNLFASATYSGVSSNTLTVHNVIAGMNGRSYRCIVSSESSASCSFTSSPAELLIRGMESVTNIMSAAIKITPNPAVESVAVNIGSVSQVGELELINTVGQTVLQTSIQNGTVTLNIHDLVPGVYITKVRMGDLYSFAEFVKK